MQIETEDLQTVKHYAIEKGVTTTTVYGWIEKGQEKSIKIDGVIFIINKKD